MKRFLIVLMILHIPVFHCGQKTSEEMMTLEESSPAVSLPKAEWGKALILQQPQGIPLQERTLWIMLGDAVVQSLGQPDIKIVRAFPAAEVPTSAFVLGGRLIEAEQIRYELNLVAGSDVFPIEGSAATLTETIRSIVTAIAEKMEIQAASVPILEYALDTLWVQANTAFLESVYERTNEAVALYKSILQEDSTFAPALNGLGKCYLQIYENQWNTRRVWLTLAQQVLTKSSQLHPDPVTDGLLGRVYFQMGDLRKSEEALRKAAALNPNLADAWARLGDIYSHYGLYAPSATAYEKALDLGPAASKVRISLAMIRIGFKEYKAAERILRKGIILEPSALHLHTFLGLALYYQNNYEEAAEAIDEGLKGVLYQPLSHCILAMIEAKEGHFDAALDGVVMDVDPYLSGQSGLEVASAAVYTLIGQNGQAVARLQHAVERGYSEYPWILNDPNFSGLKEDPRYVQLLASLKQKWEALQKSYSTL